MKKLRVSKEAFAAIEDRAKRNGLSITDYVSSLLLQELRQQDK